MKKHVFSNILAGIVGGIIAAFLVSSGVTAQRDRFHTIECTELKVIDANGNEIVTLGESINGNGGYVAVANNKGKSNKSGVLINVGKYSGAISLWSADAFRDTPFPMPTVQIRGDEDGGLIQVGQSQIDQPEHITAVALSVTEVGGSVAT